jgi:crotonobetainyl-CoA:carnitine CoA-transferase CaiB-like acyl-CoA transferase
MSLNGIRVLEVGNFITGPLACAMLSDLGAEVIKIEKPGSGDPFRAFSTGLYSPHFCAMNWTKQSITLDLTKQDALPVFRRIVETCDVLVENFRPGTADKLGIGYEGVRAINPRLVYCSISGFSDQGPYRLRPSYDMVAQAMGGYLSLLMDFSDPWIPNPGLGDQITGIYAAYGILGALLEREKTGVARRVDVTMLDSVIAFCAPYFTHWAVTKELPRRSTRAALSQSYAFLCADGKALVLHLSTPEHFWSNLLKTIEHPQLAGDPRFSSRQSRISNYESLKQELAIVFKRRRRADWLALLEANDVPCSAAYTLDEVRSDPQVQFLDTIVDHPHPEQGPILRVRRPVYYDGKRDEAISTPPLLGEHTDEVLERLGFSNEEIAKLRECKVV